MKKNNTSDHDNTIEILTYSIIGGVICLSLMPGYIPYAICYGGIIGSLYGIGKIVSNTDNIYIWCILSNVMIMKFLEMISFFIM